MSRDYGIRLNANANANAHQLNTPFMYIHAQFGFPVESIYRRFKNQSDAFLGIYPNTFPNNISELYWVQEGMPTMRPWIALGKLSTGLYFYYTAFSLDISGIFWKNGIPCGHMNLWLSPRYEDLIQSSMDSATYATYIAETLP